MNDMQAMVALFSKKRIRKESWRCECYIFLNNKSQFENEEGVLVCNNLTPLENASNVKWCQYVEPEQEPIREFEIVEVYQGQKGVMVNGKGYSISSLINRQAICGWVYEDGVAKSPFKMYCDKTAHPTGVMVDTRKLG